MKASLIALLVFAAAGPAGAQSVIRTPTGTAQGNAAGTATVTTHMQSLGYGDIHDLRRGPDGQWVGKATQNGVEHTVTVEPNGMMIAR